MKKYIGEFIAVALSFSLYACCDNTAKSPNIQLNDNQRATVELNAKTYIEKMGNVPAFAGKKITFLSCSGQDSKVPGTDLGDGYVTCSYALPDGTTNEIACGYNKKDDGCKPK